MASLDETRSLLFSQGLIDQRKLFSFVTAKKLPSGGWGFCAMGINGDKLVIFDADIQGLDGVVKDMLYEIPLDEVENFKGFKLWNFITVKFTWQGGRFSFTNLASKIGLYEELQSSCKK